MEAHDRPNRLGLGLLVGALGVVYGDIGTSPLYSVSEVFFGHHPIETNESNILGVISAMFWALVIVVTIKYVFAILKADNKGEGGIFALLGLLVNGKAKTAVPGQGWKGLKTPFVALIIIGAALLYGDGVITPAISVLSAIEGLGVLSPQAANWSVPATLGILIGLFLVQKKGTHRIGIVFGPLMAVWFIVIALLGGWQVVQQPRILLAVNPLYAIGLVQAHGWHVLFVFGAVVLCVTGVEAMYADLGHFGRPAIARTWMFFVFPCLLLNYLGQGAFLLSSQEVVRNHIFYSLVPDALLIPMVLLATAATIIASQALISGVFSLTQQAVALGLFPRVRIVHTNPNMPGQIYIPLVNWALLAGCIWIVLSFRTSTALAAAYGIAVTGTMVVTTIAFGVVARTILGWKLRLLVPFLFGILVFDLLFLTSNILKFMDGGYVPVFIALALFMVMDTWRWGRQWIGTAYRNAVRSHELTVHDLISSKHQYLDHMPSVSLVVMASRPISAESDSIPPVMAVHYRNWRRLPKHIVFLSIQQLGEAYVPNDRRYQVKVFASDQHGTVVSVRADYGYMEQPDVRTALLDVKREHMIKVPQDPRRWLVLMGAERFVTPANGFIEEQRLALFSRINRMAKPVTDYFGLERDSGVTIENVNI